VSRYGPEPWLGQPGYAIIARCGSRSRSSVFGPTADRSGGPPQRMKLLFPHLRKSAPSADKEPRTSAENRSAPHNPGNLPPDIVAPGCFLDDSKGDAQSEHRALVRPPDDAHLSAQKIDPLFDAENPERVGLADILLPDAHSIVADRQFHVSP